MIFRFLLARLPSTLLQYLLPLIVVSPLYPDTPCPENKDLDELECLWSQLETLRAWQAQENNAVPTTYNHLLQGGYFSMPSARMGKEGEFGLGYGYLYPYVHYNFRFQPIDPLEITGAYRIFKGIPDPVLGKRGFGDFSDKGANIKWCFLRPEDSHYELPGIAIGCEDFLGTRSFYAVYAVLTQVVPKYHLELSLGYGIHRIRRWFCGGTWFPFRECSFKHLAPLSLSFEYDPIPYHKKEYEHHPKARHKKTGWQCGVKYRAFDCLDLSIASLRGTQLAFTTSVSCNLGTHPGFLPKIHDPLPLSAEPAALACSATSNMPNPMVHAFLTKLEQQGFRLLHLDLVDRKEGPLLRLQISNILYRDIDVMRERLANVLHALTPDNIAQVVVVIESLALPMQEIHYSRALLSRFAADQIGECEFFLVTPLREVSHIESPAISLFYQRKERWNFELLPNVHTLFGSVKGKMRYALGLTAALNGFLWDQLFYSVRIGYFFLSTLHGISDADLLNPSQLPNVRSDVIRYYQATTPTVDEAYIEKLWNLGKGHFAKGGLGLFEREYGGVSAEWLYYPVNSPFAIGIEGAVLQKRKPNTLAFCRKIREFHHRTAHYFTFVGSQTFLNLYYQWGCPSLLLKCSVGKFLANDYGVSGQISRYFESGLQVGCWYTRTNGHDRVNGEIYYDKGIFFSIPLDLFYTRTSRSRWGYGMSAWLRDVGVRAYTGTSLYDLISQERPF